MHRFFDIQPRPVKKSTASKKARKKINGGGKGGKYNGLYVFIIICLAGILMFGFFSNNQTVSNTSGDNLIQKSTAVSSAMGIAQTKTSSEQTSSEQKTSEPTTMQSEIFPSASQTSEAESSAKQVIKITVLNGVREPGVATQVKKILEDNNIQVANVGNTQNAYLRSVIYYTVTNKSLAEKIQGILVDYSPKLEENNTLTNDGKVVVVVGKE